MIYTESCNYTMENRIKDNTLDLVVTSPPYFVGKEYEEQYKTGESYDKYVQSLLDIFELCFFKLKPGGHLWINIDDAHTSLKSVYKVNKVLPTHALLIHGLHKLLDFKELILWKKIRGKHASGGSARLLGSYGRFGSPGSIPIVQETEYILWFKKPGKRKDVTDDRRKESALTPGEFKEYGMQIWEIRPERAKLIGHPAPFPVEVPRRIIKLATFKNDLVYDPFTGSGTTALACLETDRHFIGSEIHAEYVDLANKRIENWSPDKV